MQPEKKQKNGLNQTKHITIIQRNTTKQKNSPGTDLTQSFLLSLINVWWLGLVCAGKLADWLTVLLCLHLIFVNIWDKARDYLIGLRYGCSMVVACIFISWCKIDNASRKTQSILLSILEIWIESEW